MTRARLLAAVAVLILSSTVVPAQADPPRRRCDDGRAVCLVRKYWHGDDRAALAVVDCETGGSYDESAQRRGSEYVGLFQVGTETHADRIAKLGYTTDDMRDGGKNTAVAFDLFTDEGWDPWAQCR